MWLFILEIQDGKQDGIESCVGFYCRNSSIKLENKWLLCTKIGGNNSSSNKQLIQLLSNVNSTTVLLRILKQCVRSKAFLKYNCTQSKNCTKIENANIFYHLKTCNFNCSEKKYSIQEFIEKTKYVFLPFGLFAIVGNLVVIFFVSKKLLFVTTVKENTVYNILVLNLSFADLLIAVYLIIFFSINGKQNDVTCNALGVMSVTSFQVGTTVIALICAYRLYGVLKPFSLISKKFLLINLLFVWIVWLVFSLLPIISPDDFLPNRIKKINSVLESIKFTTLNETNNTNVFSVLLNIVLKFNHSEDYTQLLKRLDIYPNMKFYKQHQVCTISFFSFNSIRKYFMLVMLSYNSLLLIFILIAYTTILKRIFNCKNLITSFFFQSPDNGTKTKESLKVFRKIFIIVVTNFVCWAPICIAGVSFYLQSLNSTEYKYTKFLHKHYNVEKVMFLLALINPLLNPYIYYIKFWKTIFKIVKQEFFVPINMLRHFKVF